MEKIGMKHDPRDDFDNPRIPPGSPLVRHVLYRIDDPTFARARAE
jgi:ribosomal-protein-alanine N-acetyltransferase